MLLVEGLFLKKLRRPLGLAEFDIELEWDGCRNILSSIASRSRLVVVEQDLWMNTDVEHPHYGDTVYHLPRRSHMKSSEAVEAAEEQCIIWGGLGLVLSHPLHPASSSWQSGGLSFSRDPAS